MKLDYDGLYCSKAIKGGVTTSPYQQHNILCSLNAKY